MGSYGDGNYTAFCSSVIPHSPELNRPGRFCVASIGSPFWVTPAAEPSGAAGTPPQGGVQHKRTDSEASDACTNTHLRAATTATSKDNFRTEH